VSTPHSRLETCRLTPRCRVLLEKLTGLQLVKKFPAFHGTRRFITALTSVRHLSLSWASPIQSIYPHPTSWRSFLILSTHLRLGLPSGETCRRHQKLNSNLENCAFRWFVLYNYTTIHGEKTHKKKKTNTTCFSKQPSLVALLSLPDTRKLYPP